MVPEDAYTSLLNQQQQLMPPAALQLSNLDQEMKSILTNPGLSVEEKYDRYNRTFNRYSHLQRPLFQPPMIPPPLVNAETQAAPPETADTGTSTPNIPVSKEIILHSLPKGVRQRGREFLKHLKRKKETIQWTSSGELLRDGALIPGSNLTELVHYFTRDRPTVKPPPGAIELAQQLQDTNIPLEAVAGNSFARVGTLDLDLGTLFSPEPPPSPPWHTPDQGTPLRERLRQYHKASPKRKKKTPVRQSPLMLRRQQQPAKASIGRQIVEGIFAERAKPPQQRLAFQQFYK